MNEVHTLRQVQRGTRNHRARDRSVGLTMNLYLVIHDEGGKGVTRTVVKSETYWDAIRQTYPGNDLMKVECIELGEVDSILGLIRNG